MCLNLIEEIHLLHNISGFYWNEMFFSFTTMSLRCFRMNRLQRFLLQTPLDVHCVRPFSPRDVFRRQRNILSFIFILLWLQSSRQFIDEHHLSCAHTFWGTSGVVSTMNAITQRGVWWRADHRRDAQVMGPNYTLHTLFSHSKEMNLFLPRLHCVNVSTRTRFPGHRQALRANTSFTSSRILSSIIKAVSRAICIILSFRGRPGSSSAGHAERTTLMKFGEIIQDGSNPTGRIRHWWAATNIFIMFQFVCCLLTNQLEA